VLGDCISASPARTGAGFDEHLALQSDYQYAMKEMKRDALRYREIDEALKAKPDDDV
jgi:hypothetical protein